MNSTVKKVIIILSIFVVIVAIAGGLTLVKKSEKTAVLKDADKIVYTGNYDGKEFTINSGDIYSELLNSDAMTFMQDMIDRHLLKSYFDKVTDEKAIEDQIKVLKYGTSDPEELSKFDQEDLDKADKTFKQNMYLLGYKTEEDYKDYAKLQIAKRDYATAKFAEGNNITDASIVTYYKDSYFEDVKALIICFNSEKEATSVLQKYNLVKVATTVTKENEDGTTTTSTLYTLRLYIGDSEWKYEVDSDGNPVVENGSLKYSLDDTGAKIENPNKVAIDKASSYTVKNTIELTDEEIFAYYLKMYNFVNSSLKNPVDENLTREEFIAQENNEFKFNYEDLTEVKAALATYLFKTLSIDSETLKPYSYEPKKYAGSNDTYSYLVYKLTQPAKNEQTRDENGNIIDATDTDFIPQELVSKIKEILVKNKVDATNQISVKVAELRAEKNLTIYDRFLTADYKAVLTNYGISSTDMDDYVTYKKKIKNNVIISVDGLEITPNKLYDYATEKNMALYILGASQLKVVQNSEKHAELYGNDFNYLKNNSKAAKTLRDTLGSVKANYISIKNYYTQLGYAYPYANYTDYLYSYAGIGRTEAEALTTWVKGELSYYLIFDDITGESEDKAFTDVIKAYFNSKLMNDLYDNYFSLNVTHLLVYVDFNQDGTADDYRDFKNDLANIWLKDDQGNEITDFDALYQAKFVQLENLITEALTDYTSTSLEDLVKEYNEANLTDSKWAPFKKLGFKLMQQSLSSSESLTYASTKDSYAKEFVDALVEMYKNYNSDLEQNINDILVETDFGLHKIVATKGSAFERPSAKFIFTDDNRDNYDARIENDSDKVTTKQLEAYAEKLFYEKLYGEDESIDYKAEYGITMPVLSTSVLTAIESFYSEVFDSLFSTGYVNILISGELAANSSTYKTEFAELNALLSDQLFADYID